MKTNSNNINNSKSSKTKSIIALTSLTIILSIVNITLLTGTIFGININTTTNANALSYSTSEDISFTLKPTLSIGLSTDSLTIDNLVPGTTSDSNTVTVTVSSNTPYGYVLSAGVGSTVSSDPYYNTSDLVHDNTTTQVPTTNKFSSIATSASLSTLTTDNTWGYSTSTNGGTSWSTYSGLSHTTTKPLLDISDPATPSTIDFKIAARSATTQASGTYNNVITFYAVGKPMPLPPLYDEVAKMSKGTQTLAQLREPITAPTTTDYAADTSNSGVYEYNSSVFGQASDASNANKIYYYRGILEPESDQGSYGSDGKATTYPNYVRLGNNTCWRIVRTTGSGGVKMVYNGTWTGSTCANSSASAQLASISPFNIASATVGGKTYNGLQYQNMQAIGYTYSNKVAAGTTSSTSLRNLLGATGNDTTTNTKPSIIKQYIEDWYAANMSTIDYNYTSSLEPAAGYCNDRSVYNDSSYAPTSVLPDNTTVIPYSTFGMTVTVYGYGAFARNADVTQNPSLTCPRGIVDNYSTTTESGGNGQLAYPVALLTADELSFAGSGRSTASQGSSYNAKSFLRSGSNFWVLSPYYRYSIGARGFTLASGGDLSQNSVSVSYGVRPAISLTPGTAVTGGSGTATDPWIVPAP